MVRLTIHNQIKSFKKISVGLFILVMLLTTFIPAIVAQAANSAPQQPTVTITNPSPGTNFTQGETINVSAAASGNVRISAMGVYFGGTQMTRVNGNSVNYPINTANLKTGTYTLKVTAVNDNNQVGESSMKIVINAPGQANTQQVQPQRPTVNITRPSTGTNFTQGETINVSATASSNVRINAMGVYFGGSQMTRVNGNNVNYSINTANLKTGPYTLKVTAVNDNNQAGESSVTVFINAPGQTTSQQIQSQPPTVNITRPSPGTSFTIGETINVSATASGNARINAMGVYFGGSQMARINGNNVNHSINTANLKSGQYTLEVTAVDDKSQLGKSNIKIFINAPRSASNYNAAVQKLNVEKNSKYLKEYHSGQTQCNIFAIDLSREMGTPLPSERVTLIHNWLESAAGKNQGWKRVNYIEAQARANQGFPTFVLRPNSPGLEGHIAAVVPWGPKDPPDKNNPRKYVTIAQAGMTNYNHETISYAWGKDGSGENLEKLYFYTHD